MATTAHKLCFTVSGDFMANFARTRVIEKRWDAAIKLLQDLHGISMDQIISILKAECTLTGDSNVGIDIEPYEDCEEKQRYLDDLNYIFNGAYVDSDGRFLRPYAYVTSWGPEDYDHGSSITKGSDSALDRRGHERSGCSLFYADDPTRDVLRHCKFKSERPEGMRKDGTRDVLFQEVRGYPTLLMDSKKLNDAQSALDQYLASGLTLREVGYAQMFPPEGVFRMPLRYDVQDPTEIRPSGNITGVQDYMEKIGSARALKIDAESSGVSIEEMQEYRSICRGDVLDKQMEMIKKADQLSDDFDNNEEAYRNRIIEQAGDAWIILDDGSRLPQAPFENWALWRSDGAHLAMPWKTICPSGLKMFGDDPYHTDFLVGGGFDLDAMSDHDSPLSKAAWKRRGEVQAEKLGFKCTVLCGTGESASLKAVHPKRGEECKADEVAIIPNAGANYVAAAMTAGAVICEQGGAMAHLVTVSRERDVKIVRVEEARKLYPEGMHLVVDCSAGEVKVPYNRIDHKMKFMGMIIDVDDLPN